MEEDPDSDEDKKKKGRRGSTKNVNAKLFKEIDSIISKQKLKNNFHKIYEGEKINKLIIFGELNKGKLDEIKDALIEKEVKVI